MNIKESFAVRNTDVGFYPFATEDSEISLKGITAIVYFLLVQSC